MTPRKGDMTLRDAIKFLETIEHSVGGADQDCDCEYCMSDKMHAIDRAIKIQSAVKALGWTPPEGYREDR